MIGIALICAMLSAQASMPAAAPVSPRILVTPFEPPARDGRTYWLGEAVAVLITDDLNARRLGAITRTARERAYDQLHLPAHAALSRATVIKVGQLAGASQVIVGDVQVDGDTLTIRARPIRIDIGRTDIEITERGDLKDLFALARRVAERTVPGGAPSSTAPVPSLQAFEQYIKGLLAEEASSQAAFLEAALKLDPGYDRARLALWDVRTAQGDHVAALAAMRGVPASSPYSRRARFRGAVSLIKLRQYDEAFNALTGLAAEEDAAAVFNNLGVVQLRRGSSTQTGKPAYFLTKAAKAEPNDPDVLFNLGYSYAIDRDPQASIYWLREALRRNPADSEAHLVLAFALESAGSTVEAGRERELAGQLSSKYAESTRRAPLDPLPRGLERIREDLESRYDAGVDLAIVSTAQRDQQDAAQFHLDRGRRFFDREQDRDAMAELRRAVFLSPYEADAHLLIGRIHLRTGRPLEAVDALKISIWSRDGAPAHVALAEAYLQLKDSASARLQVQRALALDPSSADARRLLERMDRPGTKSPNHPSPRAQRENATVRRSETGLRKR
jgi:tetratricopeptide (TPR) repeat protein